MRVLGIDTSTWRASVGVVEDGRAVAERHELVRSNHGTSLLPLIEQVLSGCELTVADIDAIAVARGPGSFTGLRISLSVAKGLALATGAQVVGIPTLEALALAAGRPGTICPMLDARKGEVYWAAFRVADGLCERLHEDVLTVPAAALAALPRPCVVLGDAAPVYGPRIQAEFGDGVTVLPFPENGPSGSVVALMGHQQLSRGGPVADEVEPIYIRPSEAEINFPG